MVCLGSLLVGKTEEEKKALKKRSVLLEDAGVKCQFLEGNKAMDLEPSLNIPSDGGAILVPLDFQIDAEMAVNEIIQARRQ